MTTKPCRGAVFYQLPVLAIEAQGSPDGISVELLQDGPALAPAEPWASMANTGSW